MTQKPDTYVKRYEEERRINVYYFPVNMPDGSDYYIYVAVSALLHSEFVKAVEVNQIPDYAVIVEQGPGKPSETVKQKMKEYYGFDHDIYEKQLANTVKPGDGALN